MGTSTPMNVPTKRLYKKAEKYCSSPTDTKQSSLNNEINNHFKRQGITNRDTKDVAKNIIDSITKKVPSLPTKSRFKPEALTARAISSYAVSQSPGGVSGVIISRAAYMTASKMVNYKSKPKTPKEAIDNAKSYVKDKGEKEVAKEFAENLAISTTRIALESGENKSQASKIERSLKDISTQTKKSKGGD